jgi:hypothetical protein
MAGEGVAGVHTSELELEQKVRPDKQEDIKCFLLSITVAPSGSSLLPAL